MIKKKCLNEEQRKEYLIFVKNNKKSISGSYLEEYLKNNTLKAYENP